MRLKRSSNDQDGQQTYTGPYALKSYPDQGLMFSPKVSLLVDRSRLYTTTQVVIARFLGIHGNEKIQRGLCAEAERHSAVP